MIEHLIGKLFTAIGNEKKAEVTKRFKEIIENEKTIKELKERIKEWYDARIENRDARQSRNEYDFDSLALENSIIDSVADEKTLDNLLNVNEGTRTRTLKTIHARCSQKANAKNAASQDNVDKIVDDCIAIVYKYLIALLPQEYTTLAFMITSGVQLSTRQMIEEYQEAIESATKAEISKSTNEVKSTIDQAKDSLHGDIMNLRAFFSKQKKQSNQVNIESIESDNQSYLDLFNEQLFLEENDDDITLKNMYVEPSVRQGKQLAISAVNAWLEKQGNCMLLYGEAGIGKSSFVAKLIYDSCVKYGCSENPDRSPVLAIALRHHCVQIKEILNDCSPEEVLKTLFKVNDIKELKGKLIVLDGYDELTVLVEDFSFIASSFLEALWTLGRSANLHILVTSRDGYFKKPVIEDMEFLCWTDKQVSTWCELYMNKKPAVSDYVQSFLIQYGKLPRDQADDQRYEILCVPFILYLCINSDVDLTENRSVCQIYNVAFRNLLLREHGKNLIGADKFYSTNKKDAENERTTLSEEQMRVVFWQYTKEIAYQMFLLNTLTLSDVGDKDGKMYLGYMYAKKRTKELLEIKGIHISETDLQPTRYLSVFSFAKSDGKQGITFVHKTVYEFFTAVKLYEDYFEPFNATTMSCLDENRQKEIVLHNTIEAFRYHTISDDILSYMCEMKCACFPSKEDNVFDFELYKTLLVKAVSASGFARIHLQSAVEEYLYRPKELQQKYDKYLDSILLQIVRALQCLTRFLTMHGYRNEDRELDIIIGDALHFKNPNVNLSGWKLHGVSWGYVHLEQSHLEGVRFEHAGLGRSSMDGAHLENAELREAGFDNASLTKAHLNKAKLFRASLGNADLTDADFSEADLTEAFLVGADMAGTICKGTHFEGAKFYHPRLPERPCKNLEKAMLEGAFYDRRTVFPEGFDPEKHGMKLSTLIGSAHNLWRYGR